MLNILKGDGKTSPLPQKRRLSMTFKRQTIPIMKRCIQIMILVMGNDISRCQDITWRCLGRSGVTRKLRLDRSETGPRKCLSPSIPDPHWKATLLMLVFQLEGNTGVREGSVNVKTCMFYQHTKGLKNPGQHTFLKLFQGTYSEPSWLPCLRLRHC